MTFAFSRSCLLQFSEPIFYKVSVIVIADGAGINTVCKIRPGLYFLAAAAVPYDAVTHNPFGYIVSVFICS